MPLRHGVWRREEPPVPVIQMLVQPEEVVEGVVAEKHSASLGRGCWLVRLLDVLRWRQRFAVDVRFVGLLVRPLSLNRLQHPRG